MQKLCKPSRRLPNGNVPIIYRDRLEVLQVRQFPGETDSQLFSRCMAIVDAIELVAQRETIDVFRLKKRK